MVNKTPIRYDNGFIVLVIHRTLMWRYRCEKVNLLTTKKQWVGNLLTSLPHSLTHWGWVTHKFVSKLTIIGSDTGLSPNQRQAIIWTNAGILLIRPIGTNFSEILIEIHIFLFKKMHLKMSSGKGRPFCLGLNMLKAVTWYLCYKIWLMWQCSHSQVSRVAADGLVIIQRQDICNHCDDMD